MESRSQKIFGWIIKFFLLLIIVAPPITYAAAVCPTNTTPMGPNAGVGPGLDCRRADGETMIAVDSQQYSGCRSGTFPVIIKVRPDPALAGESRCVNADGQIDDSAGAPTYVPPSPSDPPRSQPCGLIAEGCPTGYECQNPQFGSYLCAPSESPVALPPDAESESQGFVPLAEAPSGPLSELYKTGGDLPKFINGLFKFALIIGALAAVLRIAYAGYLYMGSDMWSQKGKAKEVLADVTLGLLLLLSIYIILQQINPQILDLKALDVIGEHSSATPSAPPAGSASSVSSVSTPPSGSICADLTFTYGHDYKCGYTSLADCHTQFLASMCKQY